MKQTDFNDKSNDKNKKSLNNFGNVEEIMEQPGINKISSLSSRDLDNSIPNSRRMAK